MKLPKPQRFPLCDGLLRFPALLARFYSPCMVEQDEFCVVTSSFSTIRRNGAQTRALKKQPAWGFWGEPGAFAIRETGFISALPSQQYERVPLASFQLLKLLDNEPEGPAHVQPTDFSSAPVLARCNFTTRSLSSPFSGLLNSHLKAAVACCRL